MDLNKVGPAVSIVIPTYNMAEFLPSAVRSALEGSVPNIEIIIVDDGSSDATADVVQRFTIERCSTYDARIRYIRQDNQGKASALNRGFGEARGEYIFVLDADDELAPQGLRMLLDSCSGRASSSVAVGEFEVFNDDDDTLGRRKLSPEANRNEFLRAFWSSHRTPFHMNACLIHRELQKVVGEMDTRLRRCQDIDYSMRLLRDADDVIIVPEVVYRYRKHRTNRLARLRHRWVTMRERPVVLWKNCGAPEKVPAVTLGIVMDAGKAVYEMFRNYEQ